MDECFQTNLLPLWWGIRNGLGLRGIGLERVEGEGRYMYMYMYMYEMVHVCVDVHVYM